MPGTGCGYLQAPFFMLTLGYTVLWYLARKLILTENISSKFSLKTDCFHSTVVNQETKIIYLHILLDVDLCKVCAHVRIVSKSLFIWGRYCRSIPLCQHLSSFTNSLLVYNLDLDEVRCCKITTQQCHPGLSMDQPPTNICVSWHIKVDEGSYD